MRRRAEERKWGGGAKPGPASGRGRGIGERLRERLAAVSLGPAGADSPRSGETPKETEIPGVPEQSLLVAAAALPLPPRRLRPPC